MKPSKRIILVGAGGAGKDFFKDYLRDKGYPVDVSYTTRNPRQGEIEGKTYHYISEEKFLEMKEDGIFYEDVVFNDWRYATTIEEWNRKNLCIKTPSGIKQLTKKDLEDSIVIYFDIPEVFRAQRLSKRKDADNVERRLKADKEDFKNFKEFNIRVTNPYFICEKLEKVIKEFDSI